VTSFYVSAVTAYVEIFEELERQRTVKAPIALSDEVERRYAAQLEAYWKSMTSEEQQSVAKWLKERAAV